MSICPTCQQPIRSPRKPTLVASVDLSTLTDSELFKYYKRSDRLETLKFWIRQTASYPAVQAALEAFSLTVQNVTIKPADFDRQFEAIKSVWRRESNARDRQAHIDVGHVLVAGGYWMIPDIDDNGIQIGYSKVDALEDALVEGVA